MPQRRTNRIDKKTFAQYMIAEIEGLHSRAIHYDQALAGKINFYLVIVTAFSGGLVLIATSSNPALVSLSLPAVCLVLAFLLVIGISTLRQCMDLAATVITLYRRVGRIRRWFADQDLKSEKYLPFIVGDDRPQFNPNYALLRGMEAILLIVNAAIAGALGGFLYVMLINFFGLKSLSVSDPVNLLIGLGIGVGLSFLTWHIQVWYAKRFMRRWEARQVKTGMVHFQSDPQLENG